MLNKKVQHVFHTTLASIAAAAFFVTHLQDGTLMHTSYLGPTPGNELQVDRVSGSTLDMLNYGTRYFIS